jgi:hypothetical protein
MARSKAMQLGLLRQCRALVGLRLERALALRTGAPEEPVLFDRERDAAGEAIPVQLDVSDSVRYPVCQLTRASEAPRQDRISRAQEFESAWCGVLVAAPWDAHWWVPVTGPEGTQCAPLVDKRHSRGGSVGALPGAQFDGVQSGVQIERN